MTPNLAALEKLLQQPKSEKRILAFFRGLPEAERREFSKHCAAWFKKNLKAQRDSMWRETSSGGLSFNSRELLPVAVLAAYCCCPFEVIKTGGWLTRINIDLVYEAMADRRPPWASQWLAHFVRSAWSSDWSRLRQLIREGVCDKPEDDHYIRLMIDGVSLRPGKGGVAARLEQDPDLRETDFWRIFEVPGVIRNESMFGYLDEAWSDGVVQLERKGLVDRERLFEAILSTPHMGFNQSQIKFFLDLHDRLQPTGPELLQRVPDYLGLVASPLAPVSKWSFELLRSIDRDAQLPMDTVAEALQSLLSHAPKARVKEALHWLQEHIQRDSSNAVVACRTAVAGLRHEKADLQAEAWKFVEAHATPDPDLQAMLQEHLPHVAASTRKAVAAWLQQQAGSAPPPARVPSRGSSARTAKGDASDRDWIVAARRQSPQWRRLSAVDELIAEAGQPQLQIPPARFTGLEFQRLANANPLPPIESLDELFAAAATVLELKDRYELGELVIDALTRIESDPGHAGFGPLKKRLGQLARRFAGRFFIGERNQVDLVPLLQAWGRFLDPQELVKQVRKSHSPGPVGLAGFLSLRNQAVFDRLVSGQPVQLLGTMTHQGGWIDAQLLVSRLKKIAGQEALIDSDLILSLLRLAPDGRSAALGALNRARKLTSEYCQALRYALGGDVKPGVSPALWVAAARSRAPFDDDPAIEKRFPDLGPDAGRVARYRFRRTAKRTTVFAEDSPVIDVATWRYPKNPRFEYPTVLIHQFGAAKSAVESLDTKPEPRECAAAAATVWPLNRDSFYAHRSLPAEDLDPLFDPCTPLHPPQTLALVESLISGYVAYAPEVASAIDLAIAAIHDGRYDAQRAGEYLAMHLDSVQRLAKSLQTIAEASPLHAFQVAQSILTVFDFPLPKKPPTRMSDLYSLLYELLQELDLPLPEDKRAVLGPLAKGASKSAKLVRRMLEFEPEGRFDADAIRKLAVEGRLASPRTLVK